MTNTDQPSEARKARDARIIHQMNTSDLRRLVDDPEPGCPSHLVRYAATELASRGWSA